MSLFCQELYTLIETALSDLSASQQSGRTPNNTLSEAHYLGAWVTTAIKSKRFDSSLIETLKGWQKQARSLGKNAKLKDQFIYLQNCYSQVLDDNKQAQAISESQILALYNVLKDQDWMVTTDLVVEDRLNRHSGGKNSLIVCAQQMQDCFDNEKKLIHPISFYIRGNQQEIVDLAFVENILLHKKTDYKSKVKYHGEYIVYPQNNGDRLPEFPNKVVND